MRLRARASRKGSALCPFAACLHTRPAGCASRRLSRSARFAPLGCGEHGGDPESVKFFRRVGLNYVSCSPFRVPVARLAAAQAAIEEKRAAKKK